MFGLLHEMVPPATCTTETDESMPVKRSSVGSQRDFHYSERPFVQFAFGTTQAYVKRSIQRLRPLIEATEKTPRTFPDHDVPDDDDCLEPNVSLDIVGEIPAGGGKPQAYSNVVLGKAQAPYPPIKASVKPSKTKTKNNVRSQTDHIKDCTANRDTMSTYYLSHDTFTSSNISRDVNGALADGALGLGARHRDETSSQAKPNQTEQVMPVVGQGQRSSVQPSQLALPGVNPGSTVVKRSLSRPIHVLMPRSQVGTVEEFRDDNIAHGLMVKSLENHRPVNPSVDNGVQRCSVQQVTIPEHAKAERPPGPATTAANTYHSHIAGRYAADNAPRTTKHGTSRISVGEGLLVNMAKGHDLGVPTNHRHDEKYSITEWNRQKVENMKRSTLKAKESLLNIRQLCQKRKRERIKRESDWNARLEQRGVDASYPWSFRGRAGQEATGHPGVGDHREYDAGQQLSTLEEAVQRRKTSTVLSITIANPPPSIASSSEMDDQWEVRENHMRLYQPGERAARRSDQHWQGLDDIAMPKEWQDDSRRREGTDGCSRVANNSESLTTSSSNGNLHDYSSNYRGKIDVPESSTPSCHSPSGLGTEVDTAACHSFSESTNCSAKNLLGVPSSAVCTKVHYAGSSLPVTTIDSGNMSGSMSSSIRPKYSRSITVNMPELSFTVEDEDRDHSVELDGNNSSGE